MSDSAYAAAPGYPRSTPYEGPFASAAAPFQATLSGRTLEVRRVVEDVVDGRVVQSRAEARTYRR